MDTRTLDLVSLGEAMVEFNQTSPNQPQYLQGFGGDTSNATIAAARAGARTAYLTRIGADSFGRALLQLWAQEGVNTTGVTTAGASHTGIYFVTHGSQGHEFSYLRADSAASRMTPQWLAGVPTELIQASRYLHLSGISLAISAGACDTAFEAMETARESRHAGLVRLQPAAQAVAAGARQGLHHPGRVAMCDIFLPSLEDMLVLTGLTEPGRHRRVEP